MSTIVLVHAVSVGSWGWKRLASFLRDAGHTVTTPSLTGIGERVHLAHPGIDLETHVTDVVNHLVYDDLTDVTLVGWSYGTMVISGVAGQVPERLRQLIFLDGIVPEDGQSLYAAADLSEAERAEDWAQGEEAGMPGFLPPSSAERLRQRYPGLDDAEWIASRLTPHPLATLAQPVRVSHPGAAALPRAFILCTADKEWEDIPFYRTIDRIKTDPAWRYREANAPHNGPLMTPQPVAKALLDLIDG
jgi:pimeloyl-ACP methyl ester carboxylesterase